MKKLPLFSLLLMLLVLSCAKEKDEFPYSKEYPVVVTNEPVDLNGSGVTFSGELLTTGTAPIISYGFLWNNDWYPYRTSWAGDLEKGEFTFRLSGDLNTGLDFTYRAFVQTEHHLILGNIRSFVSRGDLPPEIVGFSPDSGLEGHRITLIARNLSLAEGAERNQVSIGNNYGARVLSVNRDTLIFEVPETDFTGPAQVTLRVGDRTVTAARPFQVKGPVITGISKTTGYPGEELRLNGEFPTSMGSSADIYFSDAIARVIHRTSQEFTILIPVISNSVLEDFEAEVSLRSGAKFARFTEPFRILKTWEQKASPPFGGNRPYRSFTYQDKGYILELAGRQLYNYDPLIDQWTIVSSLPPGLEADRHLVVVHQQKLLILEGEDPVAPPGQLWEYDLSTQQWRQKGDMPFSFDLAVAFQLGDTWYIVTGHRAVWTYDPASGQFARRSDFPAAFNDFGFSFVQDGEIMLITYGKNWIYDAAADTWTVRSANPFKIKGSPYPVLGFTHKEDAYVIENGANVYKYDRSGEEWVLVSQVPGSNAFSAHKTVFTIGGKAYLATFAPDGGYPPALYEFLP